MFRRLTSLFISFCCLYHYSFCDCFYIFDVGQGNCQLAVFETEGEKTKIGIMYDCGSSSSKEHVKIHELKRNVSNSDQDGYHYIFKKFEKQSSKKRSNKDMSPSAKKGYSEDNYEKMSQGSISEGTKTPTSNRKKSIVSEIQKIINELKYLFIIFSHPDKDHINLFNGEQNAENVILPQNLDVGVWYGGRYWNKTGVAKDVQRSLNNEQSHTFPLIDCGKRVGATINERLPKEMSTKFTTKEREILENIYIACPRLKFGNVNSRSTVVKIKMSKLGMQFFLTGDAEAKTFSSIEEIDKDFFKKEKGYISFVMLPHHGSKDNTSDNLFELFKPDIIEISAGDGWFCHPMKELFVEKMKGRINNPEYEITFWEKFYQEEVSKLMITYLKTKENNNKKDAFILDNKRNSNVIPLICTNQLGDIKIDEVGIKAKFSNIVEKGGIKYRVDFSKRADVENVNFLNSKPHAPGSIQEASDGKYYLCVQYKSKGKNGKHKKRNYLYYHAYYNKSGHDLSLKKIQARAYKIKLLKPVNWSYLKDTEFSTGDSKVIVVKNEEGIFVEPIAFDYRADSDNPILILENGTEKSEDIKVELLSNEDIVTQGNYSVSQQYVVPEQKIQDISEEWLGLCDKLIVISDVKKDTSEEEASANLFGLSLNFLTRLFGF